VTKFGNAGAKGRRDFKKNKGNKFCDHCQRSGHSTDQCFKIIGYPGWYQGPKENIKPRRNSRFAANIVSSYADSNVDSPIDDAFGSSASSSTTSTSILSKVDTNLVQALAQEMMKLVKGKQGMDMPSADSNAYAHFAGMVSTDPQSSISCAVLKGVLSSWIINTGASDHMTFNLDLFSTTTSLHNPVFVTLPDATLKTVTTIGNIPISSSLTLHDVLYVPDFKYNLLSVGKFLTDNPCSTTFYSTHCIFQDLSTKLIMAVGKKAGGLYTLTSPSKDKIPIPAVNVSEARTSNSPSLDITPCNNSACSSKVIDVLHSRLGHTSFSKMQHIADCKPYLSNEFFL